MENKVIIDIPDMRRLVLDFNSAIAILIGHTAYTKHLTNVAESFNFLLKATAESDQEEVDAKLLEFLHKALDVLFDHPSDNRLIAGIIVSGLFSLASLIKAYRKVPWTKIHAFTTKQDLDPNIWEMLLGHVIERHARESADDYLSRKAFFQWWYDETGYHIFVTPGAFHFFGKVDYIPEHDGDLIMLMGDAIRWLSAEKDEMGNAGLKYLEEFGENKEAFYRTIPPVTVAVLVRVLDMRRDKKPDFGGADLVCRIIDALRLHARFFQDYMEVVECTAYWFRLLNDKPTGSLAAVEFENVVRRNLGLPLAFVTKN